MLVALALFSLTAKADEPFRLHRYSSFQALPACQEGDIVFIGNSITNMMNWYEAFGSQQHIHGRGNSGGYTQEILDNLESMIAGNPSKVFLMIGTNDLGTNGDFYAPALVAQRIQKIISRIRTEAPDATVYYESILPSLNGNRTKAKTEETNGLVKNWIEEKADSKIIYIDLYSLMANENGALNHSTASANTTSYSWDGLHLTQKGYRVWMEAIKEYVGQECVFPATANNIWGGHTGSNGMRVTYFGALPVKSTDILLIGDETIHNGEWHELLGSADFKDRGMGWGYPSMTINDIKKTFDAILTGNTNKGVSKEAPRAVCLYAGLSDIQAGTSAANIFSAYRTMVNELRSKLPDTPVFLLTVLPFASTDATRVQKVKDLNNSLKTLANDESKIYIIDTYNSMCVTSRDESCFMGTGNVYVSGIGYARMAQKIAKVINEKLGTDYTAVTDEEARKNVSRFNIRTAAYGNTFEAGTSLGTYSPEAVKLYNETISNIFDQFQAGTASDDALNTQIQQAVSDIKQSLVLPSTDNAGSDHEFQLFTPNRGYKYMTSTGRGKGVTGIAKNNYNESRWQFLPRTDGTWNIQNVGDKSYLTPEASFNTQIITSKTEPAQGWEFSYCNSNGLYIIHSGNVQLNQTNQEALYNWSANQNGTDRNDAGCQFQIVDVTDIEADVREPIIYPTESQEIVINKDNGELYRDGSVSTGFSSLWKHKDALVTFTAGANNMQWNSKNINAFSGTSQSSSYTLACDENYVITGYTMKLASLNSNRQTWTFDDKTVTTSSSTDIQTVSYEGLNSQSISMTLSGANTGTLITDFTVTIKCKKSTVKVDMQNGAINEGAWISTGTDPLLKLYAEGTAERIQTNGNELRLSRGETNTTFYLEASEGYVISGYTFSFNSSARMTITPENDNAVESSEDYAEQIFVSGRSASKASFVLSGADNGSVTTSNFYVYLERVNPEDIANERFIVFENPSPQGVPYRIPAIAKAMNGDIIAVADYRYSKADIGMATNGKLDLRFRIKDYETGEWGDVKTLVAAKGSGSGNIAFGDPCIVADRESNRVMVTSCCGNVSFPSGTHENHQGWARFYSEDGGQTWSDYTDISQQVFDQLDKRSDGNIRCFFIGSGKITQSTTVKVGDYYRIYCAALVKVNNGTNTNYVFYSDDFGGNWKLLGEPDDCPIPSGADEPKAEELPDGSVLVSSRIGGGRFYNIYHFTNTATGEGQWGQMATSSSNVGGITASSNACNGETLCIPVKRTSDDKKMFLLFQSVPFGPSDRSHVGINYKELADLDDFRTATDLAKDWDGKLQVTPHPSAYSTMTLDADKNIAFFYEEGYSNGGYNMVYKKYAVEEITKGAYTYADMTSADSTAYLKEALGKYVDHMDGLIGDIVGMYTEEARTTLEAARTAYNDNPCRESYDAFNTAMSTAQRVEVEPGRKYSFTNYGRSNDQNTYVMTLKADKSYFIGANRNTASLEKARQHFTFVATCNEGEYLLYHPESELYFGTLGANETQSTPVATTENAGIFRIESSVEGLSKFNNVNHTGANLYIHLAGDNTRLVPWSGSDPSMWYISPASPSTGIGITEATDRNAPASIYDLTGRRMNKPVQKGIYIIDGKKTVVK